MKNASEESHFSGIVRRGKPSRHEEPFKEYVKFIETFKRHMTTDKGGKGFELQLDDRVPGLRNLFRSFTSWIDAHEKVEWNPLSQRVYISGLSYNPSELVRDFSIVTTTMSDFVQAAHEAAHVMLWEPFFVGSYRPTNRTDFIDFSLCFEGFCFWYADILITPLLRTYLPDGEFVFGRTHVSEQYFHPYRAFAALKMDKPSDILEIYLNSFRGYKTKLLKGMSNAFVSNLSKRIYGFYARTEKPASLMYSQLKKAGIFDEYYKRFCQIPGLPSLLPKKLNDKLAEGDAGAFAYEIHKTGLDHIHRLTQADLARVRARRMIQSRAYAVFSLKLALTEQRFFSLSNRAFDTQTVLQSLESYIDQLEAALKTLAQDGSGPRAAESCRNADKFYEKSVRTPLKRAEIWLSIKGLYFPTAETPKSEFGLIDPLAANPAHFYSLASHLAKTYLPQVIALPKANSKSGEKMHVAHIYEELALGEWKTRAAEDRFVSRFNAAARLPIVLKQWSTPLDSIDPVKNKFGELLFVYE